MSFSVKAEEKQEESTIYSVCLPIISYCLKISKYYIHRQFKINSYEKSQDRNEMQMRPHFFPSTL